MAKPALPIIPYLSHGHGIPKTPAASYAGPMPGKVEIWTRDPPLRVIAWLSDESPSVTSGYGGWEEVARPRRKPLTTWAGAPALRMTLGIMLDGWSSDTQVEGEIAKVEKMGLPSGSDGQPPRIFLRATGNAIPYKTRTWVMTGLSYGEALMNEYGNRVRQQLTLELLEYGPDVYVGELSPARQRLAAAKAGKNNPGASRKRVIVHSGDTLLSIAARELKNAKRWGEIAKLNGIRDPRSLKVGSTLRLP